MKYGHTVKYNGVLYPAGAEVPVGLEITDNALGDAPETDSTGSALTFDEESDHTGASDRETVKETSETAGEDLAKKSVSRSKKA